MNNNKINFGKKGISAIVATVLIILITVAAVTIVWVAIIPMIGDQLEAGTACFDAVTGLQLLDAGYTCKNDGVVGTAAFNVSFQIKHGTNAFDLADIQVLIFSDGTTTAYSVIDDGDADSFADLPSSNSEKVFTITDADGNELPAFADIDSISIAPVISIGNSEKVCDPSGSIVLRAC